MTKGQTGVFKVQDVPIFFFNSFKFLSKKHFKKFILTSTGFIQNNNCNFFNLTKLKITLYFGV